MPKKSNRSAQAGGAAPFILVLIVVTGWLLSFPLYVWIGLSAVVACIYLIKPPQADADEAAEDDDAQTANAQRAIRAAREHSARKKAQIPLKAPAEAAALSPLSAQPGQTGHVDTKDGGKSTVLVMDLPRAAPSLKVVHGATARSVDPTPPTSPSSTLSTTSTSAVAPDRIDTPVVAAAQEVAVMAPAEPLPANEPVTEPRPFKATSTAATAAPDAESRAAPTAGTVTVPDAHLLAEAAGNFGAGELAQCRDAASSAALEDVLEGLSEFELEVKLAALNEEIDLMMKDLGRAPEPSSHPAPQAPADSPAAAQTAVPAQARPPAPAPNNATSVDDDELVDVEEESPAPSSPVTFRIPVQPPPRQTEASFDLPAGRVQPLVAQPADLAPRKWIEPGQAVTIHGLTIEGGLFYFGRGKSGESVYTLAPQDIIDPTLEVDPASSYRAGHLSNWPSYSAINPIARWNFLKWLASGRDDPAQDIGFVFIYFYGLEYRVFVEIPSLETQRRIEALHLIEDELHRLLRIYGPRSESFSQYGNALLEVVIARGFLLNPDKALIENITPGLPQARLVTKIWLGLTCNAGQPISANQAYAWLKSASGFQLRTPAMRCIDEFELLFKHHYQQRHGAGIVVQLKQSVLTHSYRRASSNPEIMSGSSIWFNGIVNIHDSDEFCRQIHISTDEATNQLSDYSRVIGKTRKGADSFDALVHLPVIAWPANAIDRIKRFKDRIGTSLRVMKYHELLDELGALGTFNKEKSIALFRTLAHFGMGIEPDALAGAQHPDAKDSVVLFGVAASDVPMEQTAPFKVASLTLQLGAAVASADKSFAVEELDHLRNAVQSWTHLSDDERRRLLAQLQVLRDAPVSLVSLRSRFDGIGAEAREAMAAFLASLVHADGQVTPAEVRILQRAYQIIGVDFDTVFSALHVVTADTPGDGAAMGPSLAPATQEATATSAPTTGPAGGETGLRLDMTRIAALQRDSDKVAAMLSQIFNQDEVPGTTAPAPSPASTVSTAPAPSHDEAPDPAAPSDTPHDASEGASPVSAASFLGLDAAHAAMATRLITKPEWLRHELVAIASELDLMLDGALEQINDAAFDAHDMALCEGDDPVTINPDFLEVINA